MSLHSGLKLSLYLDKDLAREVNAQAGKLSMTTTEFARHAIKKFVENETLEEVEKLQILNLRMFKFIASKLSHLEMLSAIAKEELEENAKSTQQVEKSTAWENDEGLASSTDFAGEIKSYRKNYEQKLKELKNYNRKMVEEIIEGSL